MKYILMSLASPIMRKRTLMFQGLAILVPSLSHLLKISLASRDRPLFHDKPRVSLVGYFYLIPFMYSEIGVLTSTLLWWEIQTGSHGFPIPFYYVVITLPMAKAIISKQK